MPKEPTTQNNKNIYLFYGEDSYSVSQKYQHWRKEFEKKFSDMNVETFEGKTLSAQGFFNAADSMPFLSEKKLIIVHNFLSDGKENEQKKVAEKIEEIGDFCFIIFVENEKPDARTSLYKKLAKWGKVEEFTFLIGPKLIQWIQNETNKKGLNLGIKETQILAETVGPNLWQMKQEIEKLFLFSQSNTVDATTIEKLVTPNLSASVFKLTDYLGQKRTKESLKTFKDLVESGEDIIKIYFMMVRQFRLIIQISDCMSQKLDKNEIIRKLKEHPFVISNTMAQSRNFNATQLKTIYQNLLSIDSDLKKGKIKIAAGDNSEFQLALEKFMVKICSS
jgi:DNA polymerase-3 subunit delta